jgi:hypothetical protein
VNRKRLNITVQGYDTVWSGTLVATFTKHIISVFTHLPDYTES